VRNTGVMLVRARSPNSGTQVASIEAIYFYNG
jgi:hypothetical protein